MRANSFWLPAVLLLLAVTGWGACAGTYVRARQAERRVAKLESESVQIYEWSRKLEGERSALISVLEEEVRRLKAQLQDRLSIPRP
jgi:hypothetical protein